MFADIKCKVCGVLQNPRNVGDSGVCVECIHKPVIDGVGKDAPTVINSAGGKQSHSPYRADLLPPHALLAVAKVLSEGAAKYGANNWHAIPAADNLNHALVHLLALNAGDGSDDHLEHAATRILFALDQVRSGRDAKLVSKATESIVV